MLRSVLRHGLPVYQLSFPRLLCRNVCYDVTNSHHRFKSPSDFTQRQMGAYRFLSTKAKSATYYYDVLGLSPQATQKQIKTAYFELSKRYHPDVNPSSDASTKFAQISEAYETLGNLNKKRAYDRGLHSTVGDDFAYRERSAAFKGKRPPPTGRTSQYNFDEFYKQHYAEQIRAEQQRRASEESRRRYAKMMEQRRRAMKNALLFLSAFWMLGLLSAYLGEVVGTRPRR